MPIILVIFILRQRHREVWYRITTSRPSELGSNRCNLRRRIVQHQLLPAEDDPSAVHPAPLEPSQRRLELAEEGHYGSDGSRRLAIRVVQLRRAGVGELEYLGDATERNLLQGLRLGHRIGRSGVH